MKTNRIPGRAAQHLAGAARGEKAPHAAHRAHKTPGDPQEFARLLADAQQRVDTAAGVGTGGGRGRPLTPEPPAPPPPASPEGGEVWAAAATSVGTPAATSLPGMPEVVSGPPTGPSPAQIAELAESLVKAARVVVVGDRSTVDVELTGGALGVSRVQVQRTGGGTLQISLSVDRAEGAKLLEQRLDSLAAALDRRGLVGASIAVETSAQRPAVEVLADDEPAARHPPGDGQSRDDQPGDGRSRGRHSGEQRRQEDG